MEINDDNFAEYFFDIKTHRPQKGQVIACYTAKADFLEGPDKQRIIGLLKKEDITPEAIGQVLRASIHASDPDCYRVPKEMANDLLEGMSEEDVLKKPYRYLLKVYYYAKPDHIPDDPHWSTISIVNLNDFLRRQENDRFLEETNS